MSEGAIKRKEESGRLVKGVYCDAYNFYLKYHGKPMEPEEWEAAAKDFENIIKKYEGALICGRILLATFSQLEEETR